RWELGRPTMEGRRLIILMVIGGMTQYLATVQGMPKEIEKKLEKRVRNFLWAEKTNVTVNKETVYAPAEMGGKNLLDIVTRNEAIAITWLKTYLSFGDERPLWCFVADEIMAETIPAKENSVAEGLRLNAYLQSWFPKVRAKDIGSDLANMIKVGRTHGVDINAIAVSREIQEGMTIWYHRKSYANRSVYNTNVHVVECLRKNHRIRTVRDAVLLGAKLDAPRHRRVKNCRCATCQITKTLTKCKNPNGCYTKARDLLDASEEKWDPREPQPEDHEEDRDLEDENPETRTFDTRVTTHGTVADTFRIFTN
ncbi:hypothetical protein B0H12DRAFT_986191, partial [Mycena haematopus]